MTSAGMEPGATREWPASRLVFATVNIGLLAILANLLNFQNYPLLRPEVGVVVLALLLISACAAGLHRLAQPRLSFAFSGLYAAVLADLGADLSNWQVLALAVALAVAAWFGERVVLKLTAAAFASVLLFQLADMATGNEAPAALPNEATKLQTRTARNEQLPPVIHLMLDSYMGLDGMSAINTNFGDLREQQEKFYLAHNFQIYPGSYSRHARTVNSFPEFLSYGTAKRATESRKIQHTTADPLKYFYDLDRKGYRTSVLSPSFMNLCPNQPLTLCRNYNRSDLSSLARSNLSVVDKTRVIGTTIMEFSTLAVLVSGSIDYNLGDLFGSTERHIFTRSQLYSLTGFEQLEAETRDLATLDHGEVRFIHLLVPHDPYVMDANCKLLPEPDWIDSLGPAPIADRDAAYARQARCMTEHGIAKFMAALDKTEAGRDAIVIIQGDHGARTVDGTPGDDDPLVDARALTVTNSAFFAIRVPGQSGAKVEGRYALDELLGGFAATGFSAAPRPVAGPAEVYLMDELWIPAKRISLPPFAQKLPKN